MSCVVKIRSDNAVSPGGEVNSRTVLALFQKGLSLLEDKSPSAYLRSLFPPPARIGIKINTIAGRLLSTSPETALSSAEAVHACGIPRRNIIIWDRTNRELKEAGFRLNSSGKGFRIMGTDTRGIGYTRDLSVHRSVGSRISRIQTDEIDYSISLAILKDHGLAGITGGMKNYFGAVHNPNKYHDNHCDPFVAHVFDLPAIKIKHRLTVIDALTVQYHMGPSFHSRWAEPAGTLIISKDPVAADYTGWKMIEALRSREGLPPLSEENRSPAYLKTAARIGLGRADIQNINLVETEL